MRKCFFLLTLATGLLIFLPFIQAQGMPASSMKNRQDIKNPTAPKLSGSDVIWFDTVDNYDPVAAYDSVHQEYLVVWWNDRGATRDIYAQRVTRKGEFKSWFSVEHIASTWTWLADIAYSPKQQEYLVVYTKKLTDTDYDVLARRVKWNGSWMSDPISVNIDVGKQWYPAVTYNSLRDEYLIVYENYWTDTMRDIDAQRVRASDGAVLGPSSGYNIASEANTIRRMPDVAYNGERDEYLIAYTYQQSALNGDIRGKIASFNFGTLSSEIYLVDNLTSQDDVALAAGPNEYLAVWSDGDDTTIYSRRVTGTGVLQPFISLAVHSGEPCIEPAVAYAGCAGYYLINWRYVRSTPSGWDIYGRDVKAGSNQPASSEFAIDSYSYSQKAPAVTCSSDGHCLMVWESNIPVGLESDYEIFGSFAMYGCAYLPFVVRSSP